MIFLILFTTNPIIPGIGGGGNPIPGSGGGGGAPPIPGSGGGGGGPLIPGSGGGGGIPLIPGSGGGGGIPLIPGNGGGIGIPSIPGSGGGTGIPSIPGSGGGTGIPSIPGKGGGTGIPSIPGNGGGGGGTPSDPGKGNGGGDGGCCESVAIVITIGGSSFFVASSVVSFGLSLSSSPGCEGPPSSGIIKSAGINSIVGGVGGILSLEVLEALFSISLGTSSSLRLSSSSESDFLEPSLLSFIFFRFFLSLRDRFLFLELLRS